MSATNHVGRPQVVIVGAGASGTLSALHLVREAGRRSTPIDVTLLDPADRWARGTAFGTPDDRHLLNVPAAGMSVLPEDPRHFVAWLQAQDPASTPATFAPRRSWAIYLDEAVEAAIRADAAGSSLRHVRRAALGLERQPRGIDVLLDDGRRLGADAVIVATGLPPAGDHWAPDDLRASPFFVPDPWAPGALDLVRRDHRGPADVLVVGTGLTMVDVVLGLEGGREDRGVHAVSRSGRLPARHSDQLRPAVIPDVADWGGHLPDLRARVRRHLEDIGRSSGDWRPGLDGLRFQVATLWQRLSEQQRLEFLRKDAGAWNVLRHRLPPTSADRVRHLQADGRLTLSAATVSAASPLPRGGLRIELDDGSSREFGWVVNCTGPQLDIRLLSNPLLDDLVRPREGGPLAVPATAGMGVRTSAGRLTDAAGTTDAPLWTLGALRRGELWESTAVPEIRTQALSLAKDLLDAIAPLPRRLADGTWVHGHHPLARPRDPLGLPISTTAEAAAAFNAGLERVLRLQHGAAALIARAVELDPEFAVGHAALALLRHEEGASTGVAASLAAARAAIDVRGDDRERGFVAIVGQLLDGRRGAVAALRGYLATHPRDALAVSVAVPTIAFAGSIEVRKDAWALVDELGPAYGDHWWFISLLAFVRQEQGRYDEAMLLAESALSCEPASGHAAHALAHVHYETGEHETGRLWLEHWLEASGRESSHPSHFVWHASLHDLALDDTAAAASRVDGPLGPPGCCGVRSLVDTTSLLWRWQVTGPAWEPTRTAPPAIAPVLAVIDRQLLVRPASAFLALHAAVAHAANGDTEALGALATHCQRSPDEATRTVVAPICLGLADLVRQRWGAAAWRLAAAVPGLDLIGGSAAQHEVIEESLLLCLHRDGRTEEVRELLAARLERRGSPLDRRRLASLEAPASQPAG